ncbi:MAG: efflux RND transporter periplasmic adaptor subunit [Xanthobacteraceae bacterium]
MHAPHDKPRDDQAKPPSDKRKSAGSVKRWVRSEFATVGLVLAALALAGGAAWWAASGGAASAQQKGAVAQQKGKGPAGIPVEVAIARATTTTTDIPAVGSLRSDENVKIAPELAGRIAEIGFQEGEPVKAGDVIVKLDDALAQAEVADAEARFNLAKANFDRAEALSKTRNIAERAHDEARANFETARAAVELARVRLSKHTITAPFSGIVGVRALSAGAFVTAGTSFVNLEKIDVLKVDFKIPEVFLADLRVGQTADVSVDALPRRTFPGEIYAIDPLVDVNGRALQVRARLKNPDLVLRPGLFARIVVKGQKEREVVLVPESAIVPRGGETFVYRIEDGKAVETKISVGNRREGQVEIVDGLTRGATVVTAGHQRLRNGATVDVLTNSARPQGRGS